MSKSSIAGAWPEDPNRRAARALAGGLALVAGAGLLGAFVAACCALACCRRPSAVQAPVAASVGSVEVEVRGLRNGKGAVLVGLHSSRDSFPGDAEAAAASARAEINAEAVTVMVGPVPYGSYAVSVLHDEDGDGEMTRNWLGMPREGHGASGDPPVDSGPPDFGAALFQLDRPLRRVEVNMRYMGG